MNNIKIIEQANAVLPSFIKQFNKRFGKKAISDKSAFVKIMTQQINEALCARVTRRINSSNVINFKNLTNSFR